MKFSSIPLLMYHDISEADYPWSVSPNNFSQQMQWLKDNGYRTISLDELNLGLESGTETSEKLVVITFDDARLGVYKHAFPILRQFNFKATLFVVPKWIEDPSSVPETEAYSNFCTWEQLTEMKGIFSFGNHTYSHANLTQLNEAQIKHEINAAEVVLQNRLGAKPDHFSYPYGRYSPAVLNLVNSNYKSAVTTTKGFAKLKGQYSRQWILRETLVEDFSRLLIKPTLSLCLIVKDEEKYLEQCLSTSKPFVDEIIIVDTGSTDKTKEIAQRFTTKIYDYVWTDDFAAARNESLRQAAGDWILILDADEIILEKDWVKILEAVNNFKISGYRIMTLNYSSDSAITGWRPFISEPFNFGNRLDSDLHLNLASGYFPSLKVRLFQNQPGFYFQGLIHELVDYSIEAGKGAVVPLRVEVHHFGTVDETKSKPKKQYYLELGRKKLAEEIRTQGPETKDKGAKNKTLMAKYYFEQGVQYKEHGEYLLAEVMFNKSTELDSHPASPKLNLAIVQQKQGKIEEAAAIYTQLINLNQLSGDSHFGLGFCYFRKGDYDLSLNHFLLAIKTKPDFVDAYINIGAIYEQKGQFSKAIQYLLQALSLNNHSGRAYYNLGVVYERQLKPNLAVDCYGKALQFNYQPNIDLNDKIHRMKEFLARN